jgi:hypothetical protein
MTVANYTENPRCCSSTLYAIASGSMLSFLCVNGQTLRFEKRAAVPTRAILAIPLLRYYFNLDGVFPLTVGRSF